MTHNIQIMGNEQVSQLMRSLEIQQKVQYLGLNSDIQSGYRLVRHNKFRVYS